MDSAVSSSPFLRSVVEAIRVRHYSIRTEKAYIDWIKRFILFHDKRHPAKMGGVEVSTKRSPFLVLKGDKFLSLRSTVPFVAKRESVMMLHIVLSAVIFLRMIMTASKMQ